MEGEPPSPFFVYKTYIYTTKDKCRRKGREWEGTDWRPFWTQEAPDYSHVNATGEAGTGGEEPMLITAVNCNTCDTAAFLMSIIAGFNSNYQDNDGLPALHYAVEFVHLQLFDTLVSKGAPLDCQDNRKPTILHCAFRTANTSVLREIFRVYPYIKTKDMCTK